METIQQLHKRLTSDLKMCYTYADKSAVKRQAGEEIRYTARETAKLRKLTKKELAISIEHGYQPDFL